MYDAQLKKMLAYVGAAIASFVAQLTVFYLAVGRVLVAHPTPGLFVTSLLWLSQCYFAVAVVTKYQELKMLEHKLGITETRRRVYYPHRPLFGKLWDRLHRKSLGIDAGDYARLTLLLDVGTFGFLILVTVMYGYIVWVTAFPPS
jgi:hypothetical protein